MHEENAGILGRPAVDPTTVVSSAAANILSSRTVVRGECRNVYEAGRGYRFTLCTDQHTGTGAVEARIHPKQARRISNYLENQCASSLETHISIGHEVTVEGSLRLDPLSGKLFLDVNRVGPKFAKVGNLSRADEARREELARMGASRHRMSSNLEHHVRYSAIDIPWPDTLSKIVVIASRGSFGADDLLRQLDTCRDFSYVEDNDVRVEGRGAAESLVKAIARHANSDADLIVVARGGGRLTALSPFHDLVLATAILRSPVPVFTAIGHAKDMTLADRAAAASFVTPTGAGNVLCARPAALRKKHEQSKRASKESPALHAKKRDVVDGDIHRRVLKEFEVMSAAHVRLQADYNRCVQLHRTQLHLSGFQRIQLRSRMVAAILVATIICGFVGLAWDVGVSAYWGALMLGCAAGAVYVLRGPRRALERPTRALSLTAEEWYAAAENVATPRSFRALWPGWPKPLGGKPVSWPQQAPRP
ncbi:exodeoxyribonuclease VII large subunit [Rhodococcoides yunnanense]|uniref:exodeoxyribonuclease VII large subunit n=1 Tax=Rhodococcoides yunnanense TaxID=278209 RepID=UPI0014750416|nr:exodeoxyribonuclease VII large subunit [Rhodococcus yunnanensis]